MPQADRQLLQFVKASVLRASGPLPFPLDDDSLYVSASNPLKSTSSPMRSNMVGRVLFCRQKWPPFTCAMVLSTFCLALVYDTSLIHSWTNSDLTLASIPKQRCHDVNGDHRINGASSFTLQTSHGSQRSRSYRRSHCSEVWYRPSGYRAVDAPKTVSKFDILDSYLPRPPLALLQLH